MGKLDNIKTLLERIHASEATGFKYDEDAILKEYKTQQDNSSNITIKVLSIFGGFLATLAFMAFLGISGFYNSEVTLLIFGITFVISAIILNRKFHKLIIDTFSISIYILGIILIAFGLSELGISINMVTLLIGLTAISTIATTQNLILSFISVLIIGGSILTLIFYNKAYNLIHLYIAFYTFTLTYIFLNEAKIVSTGKILSRLYNPVRIGIIFSLLFGLISIGKRNLIDISLNHIWISSIFTAVIIIYLVHIIIKINQVESVKSKVLIYALSCLWIITTLFAPAISGAIIIVLLSFLVNYKTGLTIGIISIIYFISQYYYDLNLTLLIKSIILFSSGIIFLGFYLFTTKNKNL
ncbi:MAG TPA: DUF4401 domain-containing protein [Xanthomarina sp.]|nr:DUF4401 domain-containing protein [Xanthomarina sp.]